MQKTANWLWQTDMVQGPKKLVEPAVASLATLCLHRLQMPCQCHR